MCDRSFDSDVSLLSSRWVTCLSGEGRVLRSPAAVSLISAAQTGGSCCMELGAPGFGAHVQDYSVFLVICSLQD